MLLQPFPATLIRPVRKSCLSPGARVRRISASSPSVELPLDSARHTLVGHGLLLLQKLRRPRGYAYPRPGNALQKREGTAHHEEERPDFDQSCSFRAFFRLRLRANASFTRFFSPGFK